MWSLHAASVIALYWPLVPKACGFLHSSLTFGEIIQSMSQARYYYLYLSIPLSIFLMARVRRAHELEIMKVRLWLKRCLPNLGWFLGIAAAAAIFACTLGG